MPSSICHPIEPKRRFPKGRRRAITAVDPLVQFSSCETSSSFSAINSMRTPRRSDGFDPALDGIWMAEVAQESTRVWSSKPRTALFLSAMRHFRDRLRTRGWKVFDRESTATGGVWEDGTASGAETFTAALAESAKRVSPEKWIIVEPGEWGVREEIHAAAASAGIPLEILEDRHFFAVTPSLPPMRRAGNNCGWSSSTAK